MATAHLSTVLPRDPPRQAHPGPARRRRVPRLRRRLDRQRRASLDPQRPWASRSRACNGSRAPTCSPTAASCCWAAAPPTCSAAGGCWSPAPCVIGLSSLVGGFAGSSGVLVGARLAQGLGAAMMLPAALSILTTTFKEGSDRTKALGGLGRHRRARLRRGRAPRRPAHRGPRLALGDVRQPAGRAARARRDLPADQRRAASRAACRLRPPRRHPRRPAACCCWSSRSWRRRTRAGVRPARSAELSRRAGAAGRLRRQRAADAEPAVADVDIPRQGARGRRRDAAGGLRRAARRCSSSSRSTCRTCSATRRSRPARPTCRSPSASIVSAGIGSQLVPRFGTRPVIVGGRAARCGRRVLAVPDPGRRLVRRRPPAGTDDRCRSASGPCSSPSSAPRMPGWMPTSQGLPRRC